MALGIYIAKSAIKGLARTGREVKRQPPGELILQAKERAAVQRLKAQSEVQTLRTCLECGVPQKVAHFHVYREAFSRADLQLAIPRRNFKQEAYEGRPRRTTKLPPSASLWRMELTIRANGKLAISYDLPTLAALRCIGFAFSCDWERIIALPRWASNVIVLIGTYVAVMIAAALWLPHEWDWSFWDWMSSQHPPTFDAREVDIVDVPWNSSDLSENRRRIATFLNDLVLQKQTPAAVILDVELGPCQTQPCGEPMESARQILIAAIRKAVAAFPVYALEQPRLRRPDEPIGGLEPQDQEIYSVLSGAAHTMFTASGSPNVLFYRACYKVPVLDESKNEVGIEAVWSMVDRVSKRARYLSGAPCDTSHVPVRVPDDPITPLGDATIQLSSQGLVSPAVQFDSKFIIVGTLSAADKPIDTPLYGPQLLAWALSYSLELGSAPYAERLYDTQPQGGKLVWLAPSFSAISVTGYIAFFLLLRRMRMRSLRPFLPWLSMVGAAVIGLAFLSAFEAWDLSSGHIQPQVTLIAVGVLCASFLSSLRAFQFLFDETWSIEAEPGDTNDYDVFVSYAHEEAAWVVKHVYTPLCEARLRDGRKLNVFFDTTSIRYGTAWQDKITLALDYSRFVVPIYSESYFRRPYCRFEVTHAIQKWIKAGPESRCVLPIMRGNPKIPEAVDVIQAVSIDVVPDLPERVISEIVDRLSRLAEPMQPDSRQQSPATWRCVL